MGEQENEQLRIEVTGLHQYSESRFQNILAQHGFQGLDFTDSLTRRIIRGIEATRDDKAFIGDLVMAGFNVKMLPQPVQEEG